MLKEAEKGMELNRVYDTSNMQIIWFQFHKDYDSIMISEDNGNTWTLPPFVDTGKWYYKDWLFKRVK